MQRILLVVVLVSAGAAQADARFGIPRLAVEGGLVGYRADVDGETRIVGLGPVVRGSLFVSRCLYVGAEVGAVAPDLVRFRALAATSGIEAHLEDANAGGFAGAALRLGPFRVKGELLLGVRRFEQLDGGVVPSELVLRPRVGVDLWLGRHVTFGVLAGWGRGAATTGLTLGLHLAPYDAR